MERGAVKMVGRVEWVSKKFVIRFIRIGTCESEDCGDGDGDGEFVDEVG
jgi:hypothetical protein